MKEKKLSPKTRDSNTFALKLWFWPFPSILDWVMHTKKKKVFHVTE